MSKLERITFDPRIMGGRACIRGTRIPVSEIVTQVACGVTPEEMRGDYPDLEDEDIREALEYAASLTGSGSGMLCGSGRTRAAISTAHLGANCDQPLAHVAEDGRTHLLGDHLRGTATRAERYASSFGADGWGRLAGLWHDLGKYSQEFQRYIRAAGGLEAHLETKPGRVDHSTPGASWATKSFDLAGRLLAYPIAGHHAGLPDWVPDATGGAALQARLADSEHLARLASSGIPQELLEEPIPRERPSGFDAAFWIRMLFSCVVDADFLDTEAFFDPEKARLRGRNPSLGGLLPLFETAMAAKLKAASSTKVNRIRADILRQCTEAATRPQGTFSLTVPTGGGKTLSSMAFALRHADHHQLDRIIYVIPYTSITEQNADVFREIFGEAVLEHHSNLDVDDPVRDNTRSRLACENWDASIVVTTSVQFFESLFASRTSRSRKLHNIARSVVVLDETQLLPPEHLNPILHVLHELRKNYGVSILLSTATQPALAPQPSFQFKGLPDVVEIVERPEELHEQLRRFSLELPSDLTTPTSWDDLAVALAKHERVLCVVNRRHDARDLWRLMPPETIHLSRLMCGEHLSARIAEVRAALAARKPVRVVSTQLVEAGVDLDFPVVYRALAGLDSIAQAGGRCNREGLLDAGEVKIFVAPKAAPGILRMGEDCGRQLLREAVNDHLAPERFTRYFSDLYWKLGPRLDGRGVLSDLAPDSRFRFSFRSAAGKVRLIDDAAHGAVVVPYRKGADLIRRLDRELPDRRLLRSLQRYTVNLPRRIHGALLNDKVIREVHPGIFVLEHPSFYDDSLGFETDASLVYDPDDLVI